MSIISVSGATSINLQLISSIMKSSSLYSKVILADLDPFRKVSYEFSHAFPNLNIERFPLFDADCIEESMVHLDIHNEKTRLNPNSIIDVIKPFDHSQSIMLNTIHD
jgi:hypothetical protein